MEFSTSLKKYDQFKNVYEKGHSLADRNLVVYVLYKETPENRLGISVSKRVGNSVVRHRLCRLVRESYRLNEGLFLRGYDIVVIARKGTENLKRQDIEKSLMNLSRKHKILNNG